MAEVVGPPWWVVPLVIAAGIALVLTVVAVRNRSVPGAAWLGAVSGVSSVWILTDILGVVVYSRPLLVGLEYFHLALGTCAVAAWFAFVLAYTGRLERFGPWATRAVVAFAGVVLLVDLTGPLHGLVYDGIEVVATGTVPVVKNEPGPLFRLQIALVFGSFPVGLVLLARTLSAHDRLFSEQALVLLVGSSIPYVAGVVDVLDLEPFPAMPVVPVSIALMGAALSYAVLREQLLGVVPATRRIGEAEAFDDLDDGVAILAADGTVLNVNDSACRAFGRDRATVLGAPLSALVGDGVRAPADLPATLERGGRTIEPRSSTIEGSTGETIGHTVLFRDVTESRRREQRLTVLNRVLGHDLRNAMTAVRINVDLLVDADDRAERAALAESIRASLDDLDALGTKARVAERAMGAEPGPPRRVDLAALLDGVVGEVSARFPDAAIAVEVPDGTSVVTHPDRLAVALRDVVENAVVHAPGPSHAEVAVTPGDGGVTVAVTDDGPGIPDHEIAVLEEGTETPLEHGSGIGLWLVHWAVTSLGGEVTFEETADGNTVRLWIPDRDGEA